MQSFTLEVEFVGLCMFATEQSRVTVLLPNTSTKCCHSHMPHKAELEYCMIQNGQPVWGKPVPLENVELDLSTVVGDPFVAKRPLEQIPDLSPITKQKLDPDLISHGSPKCVRTRIRIASGKLAPIRAKGMWEIPGHVKTKRMTHRTILRISGVPGATLKLDLNGLHGKPVTATPPVLEPIAGVIKLRVLHTPPSETHAPVPGHKAKHFACYYGLFKAIAPHNRPVPEFRESAGKEKGHLLTCMQAQAPVG